MQRDTLARHIDDLARQLMQPQEPPFDWDAFHRELERTAEQHDALFGVGTFAAAMDAHVRRCDG